MVSKLFIGLFFLIYAVSGTAQGLKLATIADELVDKNKFQEYTNKRIDLRGQANNTFAVEMILREMLFARALELEGDRLGIGLSEDKKSHFDDIRAHIIYRKIVTPCVRLNEGEARDYFKENRKEFFLPDFLRLSRIMLPTFGSFGGKSSEQLISNWLIEYNAGAIDFSEIVNNAEKLYNSQVQGDIGWIAAEGDMQPMIVLKSAVKGEVVGPIQIGDFFYLFKISDKKNGRLLEWDEISSELVDRVYAACMKGKEDKLRSELFSKYKVMIYRDEIQKFFSNK